MGGSSRVSGRSVVRGGLVALVTGALSLGLAWAGVVAVPVPGLGDADAPGQDAQTLAPVSEESAIEALQTGTRLPGGTFLAGAAKVSIAPDPAKWTPEDGSGRCGPVPVERYTPVTPESCLLTFDARWATGVDPLGVYARAAAISNGETTVAWVVLDTVGWFAAYPAEVCADCGAEAIARTVEQRTGGRVKADGVVIASTHTHASADTLALTPTWYYEQVRDAVVEALVTAATDLRPAVVETGATPAKQFNTDRRIVTRAIPDAELTWIRAFSPPTEKQARKGDTRGETIATLASFSVHPTVKAGNAELHAGLVGPFARDVEAAFGGTALWLPGGLGDQTVDRSMGVEGLGGGMADLVVESQAQAPYRLRSNDIAVDQRRLQIPIDNATLTAARLANLFVRDFLPPYGGGPHAVEHRRGGVPRPTCATAGPTHIVTPVGGIRLGTPSTEKGDRGDAIAIMTAPGEIFASISLVTKDYLSRSRNVMVVGMANDTIGYIIPFVQYDQTAEQGVGLGAHTFDWSDYEEVLSTSRCTGDLVQTALIHSGQALGLLGPGERP